MFIVFRIIFYLLFRYRISIFFRPFAFFLFLIPMILDGNLQSFFFLMFSQRFLLFSVNIIDKYLNIINCFIYFIIFWFSFATSFLAYSLYKKLTKYILDNWRVCMGGLYAYCICNVGRMLVFGYLHNLLRFNNKCELLSLCVS
jgi:hypothetical protein